MFDPKDAARLLRQDWKNPTDLARELYDMLTSTGKDATTVSQPLEISTPQGQPGLKLTRPEPKPGEGPSTTTRITSRSGQPSGPISRPVVPTVTDSTLKPRPTFTPSPTRPRSQPQSNNIKPVNPLKIDVATGQARTAKQRTALKRAQGNSPSQGQLGSGEQGSPRGETSAQSARFAKAYQSPQLETTDEVRFSGNAPVQFDRMPYVYNIANDDYEPFNFPDNADAQPAFADSDGVWGMISSGKGQVYQVTLLPSPDPTATPGDTVSVTFVMVDPTETIPPKTIVYPLYVDDDGNYWGIIPVWI